MILPETCVHPSVSQTPAGPSEKKICWVPNRRLQTTPHQWDPGAQNRILRPGRAGVTYIQTVELFSLVGNIDKLCMFLGAFLKTI